MNANPDRGSAPTPDEPTPRVCIVMAMDIEAAPIIMDLGATTTALPEAAGPVPFRWHEASYPAMPNSVDVLVTVNGVDPRFGVANIGTQPAALNTYISALHWHPDLIVSAGAAGGWTERGAQIGDLYIAEAPLLYHDRRIDMPGFDTYGVGSYPCLAPSDLVSELGAKCGRITTSNSLDETDEDRSMIARNGGDAKEMEAAAVGWAAEMMGVPMMALKTITDLVDSPVHTAQQFEANLGIAMDRLRVAIPALLSWVGRRGLGNLSG